MPLSTPVERELLHLRDIELRGWQRSDGLYDIEAHLLDTKTYAFSNESRGEIPADALQRGPDHRARGRRIGFARLLR